MLVGSPELVFQPFSTACLDLLACLGSKSKPLKSLDVEKRRSQGVESMSFKRGCGALLGAMSSLQEALIEEQHKVPGAGRGLMIMML